MSRVDLPHFQNPTLTFSTYCGWHEEQNRFATGISGRGRGGRSAGASSARAAGGEDCSTGDSAELLSDFHRAGGGIGESDLVRSRSGAGQFDELLSHNEVDKVYTEAMVKQCLSAGWGPITYRQNTELTTAAWHWNPNGAWSDAANQRGYFAGSAGVSGRG